MLVNAYTKTKRFKCRFVDFVALYGFIGYYYAIKSLNECVSATIKSINLFCEIRSRRMFKYFYFCI